jgi:6-phosphogluconolactonase/glucosamine-6-phosphate isomerase/deaminase
MKIVPNSSADAVVAALSSRIIARISRNQPVLLLVTGSDCESLAIGAFRAVSGHMAGDRGRLKLLFTVGLTDERFGKSGHADSIWRQLVEKGFDTSICNPMPILVGKGSGEPPDLEETVRRYDAFLSDAAQRHSEGKIYIACLLALGDDGHVAGILPESPPSLMLGNGARFAAGYRSALFPRVTVTPSFFPSIDYAATWVSGLDALPALELLSETLPPDRNPAQLLKLPAESEIFAGTEVPGRILKRA